jgi:hypothetical protein
MDAAPIAVILPLVLLAMNWRWKVVQEARARQRTAFADAFSDAVSYREFAFMVRRREAADPRGERSRISANLSQLQSRLAFHQAWIQIESPEVAARYERLLGETRRIAGQMMHEAWTLPPVSSDAQMNLGEWAKPLEELHSLEAEYLKAVRVRLRLWRWLFGLQP